MQHKTDKKTNNDTKHNVKCLKPQQSLSKFVFLKSKRWMEWNVYLIFTHLSHKLVLFEHSDIKVLGSNQELQTQRTY